MVRNIISILIITQLVSEDAYKYFIYLITLLDLNNVKSKGLVVQYHILLDTLSPGRQQTFTCPPLKLDQYSLIASKETP